MIEIDAQKNSSQVLNQKMKSDIELIKIHFSFSIIYFYHFTLFEK